MSKPAQSFGARAVLNTSQGPYAYYRLATIAERGIADVERLPVTVKLLLENVLRHAGRGFVGEDDVMSLAKWQPGESRTSEIPFMPARVVLQDLTGVPCVADLAAMRAAVARLGGDPKRINPLVPVDLVIDHSVQVDLFGTADAFVANVGREYERNAERFGFLRWAQQAFENFRVVPPGTGIVHQVNLEYLSQVVQSREIDGERVAIPDTLVGTDSHTTMVNGLGVLGWGAGGIEAEAAMLGQPLYIGSPTVVGFRMVGSLAEGVTATDLVLTVTQILRKKGVVDKFIEFTGPGVSALSLPDRATISNMAPEYGATAALFPIDGETLRYLRLTGRDEAQVELVEAYARAQGIFRTDDGPEPLFDEVVELDLATIVPSVAGPRRPQDRVELSSTARSLRDGFSAHFAAGRDYGPGRVAPATDGGVATLEREKTHLPHGSVVIAAITSCTNTSNPSVMVAAGLLAKKAVERGLTVAPHVKTSLSPGSTVVTEYLNHAGLTTYLDQLRFNLTGYGCMTCIGNSGPLPEPVARAISEDDVVGCAVLSGNRNFEGRIHPLVRASYLASPPLVVAFALAGTVDIDLANDPIGTGSDGKPVYLRDVWPSREEIRQSIEQSVTSEMFSQRYADVFTGDETWRNLPVPEGDLYAWDQASTYIQEPPFFANLAVEPSDITEARALVVVGDSVTTDHISPAGSIAQDSPAGRYLTLDKGVTPREYNSYGARRGNHEVMMRGTFANIRLRNALAQGREGNWTEHIPSGELMNIWDAAEQYQKSGTPLIVVAGKEYGSGSSRDWAAKGPLLQGVKAVIAESYERIHRSNLAGMGVLPLQFLPGESLTTHGLSGREVFAIEGISEGLTPRQQFQVRARRDDGTEVTFAVQSRLDGLIDIEYYHQGGILPYVLRQLTNTEAATAH
jgi:aconitate hydratase